MKTALQTTMHFVRNYGAVLQTYALQQAIESFPGWECKTLDIRPHWEAGGWSMCRKSVDHAESSWKRFARTFKRLPQTGVRKMLIERPWAKVFNDFVDKELNLTRRYEYADELAANPPTANLYITGSDQTFNTRFTHGEGVWLYDYLSNASLCDGVKISYASSMGKAEISQGDARLFHQRLSDYNAISVREISGVKSLKRIGIKSECVQCCDPTLLLNRCSWMNLVAKSKISVKSPYILCYNLRYAVDPYPQAEGLERKVSEILGLPIYHLVERPMFSFSSVGKVIRNANVYDFVRLIFGASFVMTSSLHGTLFALLNERPFLSYVGTSKGLMSDCRVLDLLKSCNAIKHAVPVSEIDGFEFDFNRFAVDCAELETTEKFRSRSIAWLARQMEQV